jgi:hypothetical protein
LSPSGQDTASLVLELVFANWATRRDHRPKKHNVVKIMWGNWEQPWQRTRTAISAKEELAEANDSRSIADMLRDPPSHGASRSGVTSPADSVVYSFDSTQSPNRPMALDLFVKATGRETEKLVEREYEVVDEHGDAVKGRKARKTLRNASGQAAPETDMVEEDDGFELI